jgi:hypothetical protein
VVEAARVVDLRLREFGNIRGKAYEEESVAVNLLLSDFAGALAPQVATLQLTDWTTELAAAEIAFAQLYVQRNTQLADRPQGRLTDVRREIEAVYHGMISLIDASAILNGSSSVYSEFIAQLNQQVTYFNDHNHHHAKKDLGTGDHCVVEPIETQTYTGKPISVIPKVHYREEGKPTVELIFAKDFNVTYKNNEDVGTATLTIHGKGAYRGQKLTTFNIAR